MRKTEYYRNIKKLWAYQLKLTILDLHDKDLSVRREAHQYIKSDDPDFPSFVSLCEIFNYNSDKTRTAIFERNVKKKDFVRTTTSICSECGKRRPVDEMTAIGFHGMYICAKCKRL